MKQLDPKAVWLFFFNYLFGILFIILPFALVFSFTMKDALPELKEVFGIPAIIVFLIEYWWIVFIILVILVFVWSHLSYRLYKYELTEDGFKKELGVIWKKYVTIPYDRIQNVDIYRGVLARILGLSDLQIQTAGMSAVVGRYGISGAGAEGRLPGLSKEEAEKLRDELVKRAKGHKNQGL